MTALQSAKRTKEAHDKSRAAKLSKQEVVPAKAKAKAKAGAGRGAQKKLGAPPQFGIFDCDFRFVQPVAMIEAGAAGAPKFTFDVPFVVRPCATVTDVLDRPGYKLNAMVFKAGLIRLPKNRDARLLTALPTSARSSFRLWASTPRASSRRPRV